MPGTDPFLFYVEQTREGADLKKALDNRSQELSDLDLRWKDAQGEPLTKRPEPPPPPPMTDEGDFGANAPSKKYWNQKGGISDTPSLGPAISTLGKGALEVVPSHVAKKRMMSGKYITPEEETSFMESVGKGFETVPSFMKQSLAGLVKFTGDTGMASAVEGPGEGSQDPNWQAQVMGQEMFREARKEIQSTLPDVEPGSLKAHVYGAAQSLGLSTAAFTTGILTGSTLPLLALASVSGAQEYGAQREGGSDVPTAVLGAVVNGLAEYWGERLPFNAWRKASGYFEKMVASSLMDSVGELGTQTVQSAVQKFTYEPGMTWDDFTKTMQDTLIQSLMAGGVQTGAIGAVQATQKTDYGPIGLKENVEQNFQGSKVEIVKTGDITTGANITLPSGRVVEVHNSESPMADELKKQVAEGAKKKGIDTKDTAISGVYFRSGLLVGTENDLIYLTGQQTDVTTLPHEKGHLIVELMRDTMTPQELEAIGIPATGEISEDLEEGVMTTFEEYAYKRTPSMTNPMSPLDKAYQNVIDFAHEIYTAFGGATTQRQVFEEMRTGKILAREGATRQAGESDAAFQVRTRRPMWHEDDVKTRSGQIVGAAGSHLSHQAREGLIRRMTSVASRMYKANPEQTKWYKLGGEDIRRVFGLTKKEGEVKPGEDLWEGDVEGADRFLRAVAQWSIMADIGRNTSDAVEVMRRILAGGEANVAGTKTNERTMADRFVETMKANEVTNDLAGFGPKAVSFYWDLHNATFGVRDDVNTTIDRHIIAAWDLASRTGRPMKGLGDNQYRWANNVMREITKRFNQENGTDLTPSEVQPLMWAWQRAGRNYDKQDVDHIGKHIGKGIVTGEMIPATDSDLTPWIHEQGYAMKKAYSQYVAERVLYDENGNDRILAMMGLSHLQTPGDTGGFGLGTWDGAINPNVVAKMHLAGMSEKAIRLYADLFGYIFTQNAVGWYQPDSYHTNREGSLQGWKILREDGGQITDSLAASYYEILKSKVPKANITFTGDEIHVVNYMGMDVKELQRAITEVGREWKEKHGIEGAGDTQFGVIGDLQSGDEEGSAGWTGGLYKSRIREAGRSDLLEGADRERASAVAAAREYSEQVAPPGAKFQGKARVETRRYYLYRDIHGKDITPLLKAVVSRQGEPIRIVMPSDRIWLTWDGKSIGVPFVHQSTAQNMVALATSEPIGRPITGEEFGAATQSIRFHGFQRDRWRLTGENVPSINFEIFAPITDAQMKIIENSVGFRGRLLVDLTGHEGEVFTYVEGRGPEAIDTLKKTIQRVYVDEGRFQTKTVQTPAGEFPLEHQGWRYQGEFQGFHQYTLFDPARPEFTPTLLVDKPENLQKKIDSTLAKWEGGKMQTRPALYSAAMHVVATKFPASINGNDLIPLLKKYGIKDAEINDLGIVSGSLFHYGAVTPAKISRADLVDYIRINQIEIKEVTKGEFYATASKFGSYVLPGGEDYRELLLTVSMVTPEVKRLLDVATKFPASADRDAAIQELRNLNRARGGTFADLPEYKSPHWEEPNVLAHVRFNDRTGPNGEKLLHLEEKQSDWSAELRANKSTVESRGLDVEEVEGQWFVYDSLGAEVAGPFPTEGSAVSVSWMMAGRDPGDDTVPAMPFSGDWKELVAKRMIVYAAQNGYDGVTWTTGEQQAARYDLSKVVKEISYIKRGNGTFDITVDVDTASDIIEQGVTKKRLTVLIGKEVAEKMDRLEGRDQWKTSDGSTGNTLRGLDLKVGGEWAKKLYDEKFVSIYNKIAKKWGGKVGTIGLEAGDLSDITVDDIIRVASSKEAIPREMVQVHHLALPEQMKQEVAQGLPMYQTRERTPGPKGLTVNFTDAEVTALGEELLRGAWEKLQFTQTNDESLRLAKELITAGKMNLDTFLNHDPYTAWPDTAHQVAAEHIAGGVFDYVKNQIAEYKAGRITADEARRARIVGMASIAQWYLPQSEVGRMLQARQLAVTPESIPVRDVMEEQKAFEEDLQEMIDKGLITEDQELEAMDRFYSIDAAQNFVRRVAKKKVKDVSVLNQLFYFSLLSNPVTQAANIVGNIGPLFFATADQYVAEKTGSMPKGGTAGMMAGLYHSVLEAFILAGRAGYTGESSMKGDKFRNPRETGEPAVDQARGALSQIMADKTHPFHDPKSSEYGTARRDVMQLHRKAYNPISGDRLERFSSGRMDSDGPLGRVLDVLGEIVDSPFKGLAAGDEFFKVINQRMWIWKSAYEMATENKLEGQAFDDFVAKFVDDPPEKVAKLAEDFAAKQTFTSELGPIAEVFQTWNREYPAFRVIVPFVTVIGNIAKYNLEHTPFAYFFRQVRADISKPGPARDMALSKMAVGSAMMTAFAGLAAAGLITGGGPSDPALKKLWSQPDSNGDVAWQEYSFKVGKKWISYKRIEPFATPIGVAADLIEILKFAPRFEITEAVIGGAIAFTRNFTSKTYAQGISNFLEAITSGGGDTMQSNAGRWIKSTLGMVVPGGVAQVARVADPVKRDVDGWIDKLKSRVPGLSTSLEPQRNLKGDVMTVGMYESIPGKGLGMVNPFMYAGTTDDVVTKEIVRNRIPLTMPSRRLGGGSSPDAAMFDERDTAIMLTPEQYGWFVMMAGNGLKDPKTGRGAWDMMTAIINGAVPVIPGLRGKEAVYYNQKNPDGTPVFSDGPEGGKAAILEKVVHTYRNKVRDMIEQGDVFPAVRNEYISKTIGKKINRAPNVGGGR